MNRVIRVTWKGVEGTCKLLANSLPRDDIRGILTVARGGLVPASMIAYRLDIPIVGIASPVTHFIAAGLEIVSDGLVVIDDICDTGRTFFNLRKAYPNALFASLFIKPHGLPFCDYWAAQVLQTEWVIFPWAPYDEVNRCPTAS